MYIYLKIKTDDRKDNLDLAITSDSRDAAADYDVDFQGPIPIHGPLASYIPDVIEGSKYKPLMYPMMQSLSRGRYYNTFPHPYYPYSYNYFGYTPLDYKYGYPLDYGNGRQMGLRVPLTSQIGNYNIPLLINLYMMNVNKFYINAI